MREIRKRRERGEIEGHVLVIAVTANASSEQIAVAKEAGMDSVVTKPFKMKEVLTEIEKQLRGRE